MCFIVKTYNFIKNLDENKKKHCALEFSLSQRLKSYVEFKTQKEQRPKK